MAIELNKPEFFVVIEPHGAITIGGIYVVKVTYKLGVFNYIRKHREFVMRVDCVGVAEKYCAKLNEAQKEMEND